MAIVLRGLPMPWEVRLSAVGFLSVGFFLQPPFGSIAQLLGQLTEAQPIQGGQLKVPGAVFFQRGGNLWGFPQRNAHLDVRHVHTPLRGCAWPLAGPGRIEASPRHSPNQQSHTITITTRYIFFPRACNPGGQPPAPLA